MRMARFGMRLWYFKSRNMAMWKPYLYIGSRTPISKGIYSLVAWSHGPAGFIRLHVALHAQFSNDLAAAL